MPEAADSGGTLVLVVGPSGAGKDTLIDAARRQFQGDERFVFPRRLITRTDSIGEDHIPITWGEMAELKANGGVLFDWEAHGLTYAVPASVLDELRSGRICIINVSRKIVGSAPSRWPRVSVVQVTADLQVLEQRLKSRGRESGAAVTDRMSRVASVEVPEGVRLVVIDNSGAVEPATAAFVAALREVAAVTPESVAAAR